MRGVERLLLLLLWPLLVTACGANHVPVGLTASATQFRTDEGSTHLSAGIQNKGNHEVSVDRVRLRWPGLRGPWTRVDKTIAADDGIAFQLPFAPGNCVATKEAPRLEMVVDGEPIKLPLAVDPGLLDRLQHRLCGLERLATNAAVQLEAGRVSAAGYVTAISVRRTSGEEPVTLTQVGGSVLLRMLAPDLPQSLSPTMGAESRIPLTIAATPRCDPHAQSQSSQTFLLSAYFRVGAGDAAEDVRVILPLSAAVKADLQRVIDDSCGLT